MDKDLWAEKCGRNRLILFKGVRTFAHGAQIHLVLVKSLIAPNVYEYDPHLYESYYIQRLQLKKVFFDNQEDKLFKVQTFKLKENYMNPIL